jgi:hypothetical protein
MPGHADGVPADAAQRVGRQAALPLKPDERQTRVMEGDAIATTRCPVNGSGVR